MGLVGPLHPLQKGPTLRSRGAIPPDMVRIDTRYVIPAPREVVWSYLSDPAREKEYGWSLNGGGNEILERTTHGVRFRGGRDRKKIGRRDFASVFEGRFDRERLHLHWRIVDGFEAGSAFTEELLPHPEGTEVHVHGEIRFKGVDWDQRLQAFLFPSKARAVVERNLCRDYKALKTHLLAQRGAAPSEASSTTQPREASA